MNILLIEHEHKVASIIKRSLEQESHTVTVAYDGQNGFTMATSQQHDLVIVDRDVTGNPTGLEIIQEMRVQKNHTPVLMLTAAELQRAHKQAMDTVADAYLKKPFSLLDLYAHVRSLNPNPSNLHSQKLVHKNLALDPINYTVSRAGTMVELTGKEFTLLEYLMRNPGRILTKDMITAHVWDYDATILPNTIEVYMGYLRNKVEKPFGTERFVRTRRGFGYIFGEN